MRAAYKIVTGADTGYSLGGGGEKDHHELEVPYRGRSFFMLSRAI